MYNQEIVEKIKSVCKLRNLKISELLKKAGLSPNVVEDWHNNKKEPSFPALFEICKVLNIEIEDLFRVSQLRLTNSQVNLLKEWNALNNVEKQAIIDYISALKSNRE